MKRAFYLPVLVLLLIVSACGTRTRESERSPEQPHDMLISEAQQSFFNNLSSLCGKSFAGKQIYRSHHASGWAHLDMVMHVEVCERDQILIPFHVGEDQSRTWMFLVEDGLLRLRHDHRYPDGTPEEESLYGGYADDRGTAFVQHFPADQYTAGLIDGGGGNIWTIRIDEGFTTFTYRLERDDEKRLRVDFDLSNPL